MAHKGDFPECNVCTSFQCRTCGLDSGVFQPEGDVTRGNSLIKYNLFIIGMMILCFLDGEKEVNIINIAIGIGGPIVSIYLLLAHRWLSENKNTQEKAGEYMLMALGIDAFVFLYVIWPFIKIFL